MRLLIDADGTARCIHDDVLADILRGLGPLRIKRASHVEPNDAGLWVADLSPVDGPSLGPYATRQEALEAEAEWLNANDVPVPA